jgi:Xaa-Pro aminopeptidase
MERRRENRVLGESIAVLALLAAGAAPPREGREERFFDWTQMQYPKEVYHARREKMMAGLRRSGGGVFLIPSAQGLSDGFTFRQLDDFLYFSGLELPDSMLVLDADEGRAYLFAPSRDARFENAGRPNDFPGRLLGADPDLSEESGIENVREFGELAKAVERWVSEGKSLRLNLGRLGPIPTIASGFAAGWTPSEALAFHVQRDYPRARLENAYPDLARIRMVHGPEEIDAMRRVCDLTASAIHRASGFVRAGVDERTLEAELEAAFKRGGSQRLAFASIIKSGPNSLWPWRILAANYDRRNRVMLDGELVVFDVGTELDYTVSDVGRTFPVSGRFSEKQKAKLEMVVAVSDAILAAIRPGVTFSDLKEAALRQIPESERRYMQAAGFYGHHIGLSSSAPALAEAPLEPGMVFTVEPWYYNHDEEIAIFIEDVVLVTGGGHENLTASLPRTAEALELMTGVRSPSRGQRQ